jgi:tetratricopeptide (TPR) repeat protein
MRKPLSPLQAFAEDARTGIERAFDAGEELVTWLSLAQAADTLSNLKAADRTAALSQARTLLEPFAKTRPSMIHDAKPAPTDDVTMIAEQFRVAAEAMENAGCFELAYSTVSAVCRLTSHLNYVDTALATTHLGRIARQMNDLGTAEDCYQSMLETSMRKRDGPLAARGHIGLALLHDMRGNLPAAEAGYLKALDLAVYMGPTYASACQGLMTIAIDGDRLADALLYGWKFYDATEYDPETRTAALTDLSVVALRAGFFHPALFGFEHALTRASVPRIHMVILAGAMRAAARLGLADKVRAFDRDLERDVSRANFPHIATMALLYAAEAWGSLREFDIANDRLQQCLKLGRQFDFHQYVFRAEALADSWEKVQRNELSLADVAVEGFIADGRNDPMVGVAIHRFELLAV